MRRLLLLISLLVACSPPDPATDREPTCRRSEPGTAVRWMIPRLDRARLDAWCATVGPPSVDVIGDSTATIRPDSLAIIAWNAHVGSGNIEGLLQDFRQGRFTDGRPVRHFVLLIQEALRTADSLPSVRPVEVPDRIFDIDERSLTRTDVVRVAEKFGLAFVYIPSMRNGATHAEDRGNAILSSLPLSDVFAIELPLERQRRVSVGANVPLHGTDLIIASVHLENRSSQLLSSFGSGRLRQAVALSSALPRDTPAVIGGDLNTWFVTEAEPALRYMRRQFSDTPDIDIGPTFAAFGFGRTTDHLFFRLPNGWHVTYRRINHQYGSDHFPVLGVIWRE